MLAVQNLLATVVPHRLAGERRRIAARCCLSFETKFLEQARNAGLSKKSHL